MLSPDAEAVLLDAVSMEGRDFVGRHLLAGEAHACGCDTLQYRAFRGEMAALLSLHPDKLFLVGSGKTGFSQNPSRLLRPFGSASDLDLVVVAPEVFDAAALELAETSRDILLGTDDDRRRLRRARADVFNGYLRPDHLPLRTRLAREWFPLLAGPFMHDVARRHQVRAWIFKTREHAVLCYSTHHDAIRADLARLASTRGVSRATQG